MSDQPVATRRSHFRGRVMWASLTVTAGAALAAGSVAAVSLAQVRELQKDLQTAASQIETLESGLALEVLLSDDSDLRNDITELRRVLESGERRVTVLEKPSEGLADLEARVSNLEDSSLLDVFDRVSASEIEGPFGCTYGDPALWDYGGSGLIC